MVILNRVKIEKSRLEARTLKSNPQKISKHSILQALEISSFTIDLRVSTHLLIGFQRRGDRVADCASLERMCGGNSTEGSNPSLSAI